jgi:hypothetical protein
MQQSHLRLSTTFTELITKDDFIASSYISPMLILQVLRMLKLPSTTLYLTI